MLSLIPEKYDPWMLTPTLADLVTAPEGVTSISFVPMGWRVAVSYMVRLPWSFGPARKFFSAASRIGD